MNNNVEEYLKFYFKKDNVDYCIALTGTWGAGKTYFIKEYLDSKNDDSSLEYSPIFINLFGLKTIEEVEHIITLKRLYLEYPELSKDNIKNTAIFYLREKLSKNKDIGTLIKKYEKKHEKTIMEKHKIIYIFDELERSSIEIKLIMGFIHNLIDTEEVHTIIILNENELIKQDDYAKYKDKVIGKTFVIKKDTESALKTFVKKHGNHLDEREINKVLEKITPIENLNLRLVKQTCIEFDYFKQRIEFDKINFNIININKTQLSNLTIEYFYANLLIKHKYTNNPDIKTIIKSNKLKELTYDGWEQLLQKGYLTSEEWSKQKKNISL